MDDGISTVLNIQHKAASHTNALIEYFYVCPPFWNWMLFYTMVIWTVNFREILFDCQNVINPCEAELY